MSVADVKAGRLGTDGFDVFVVPGVGTGPLETAPIQSWIEAGGVFVGTGRPGGAGGTPFAVASGWTSATLSSPAGLDVPGSLFRVELQQNSPVTLGAGEVAYWFHLGEQVLSPSTTGANAALFPSKACHGDCGGDGEVTVNELLTLGNIALGYGEISGCRAPRHAHSPTSGRPQQRRLSRKLVPRSPHAPARGDPSASGWRRRRRTRAK